MSGMSALCSCWYYVCDYLTFCGQVADLDPITVPTVGFSTPIRRHMFSHDIVVYDLGGGARIRGVWPSYFAEIHGVVFVVDAADTARMDEAAKELEQALLHPMVVGKPLLILANKQDLPHAASEVELAQASSRATLIVAPPIHYPILILCRFRMQGVGLDRVATLFRHHISGCIAKASLNGGVMDARINDGLQWLIEAVGRTSGCKGPLQKSASLRRPSPHERA